MRPARRRTLDSFFERPILNSPYGYPGRYWELDQDGQPTNQHVEARRRSARDHLFVSGVRPASEYLDDFAG